MSSPEISEKNIIAEPATTDKIGLSVASSHDIEPIGKEHLHFVPRTETLPEYDLSQETITGFDADLMGARTVLSAEEEKKLLRRIDWHLIPLLAVIYMLKSMDAQNVSPKMVHPANRGCLLILT